MKIGKMVWDDMCGRSTVKLSEKFNLLQGYDKLRALKDIQEDLHKLYDLHYQEVSNMYQMEEDQEILQSEEWRSLNGEYKKLDIPVQM